MFVFPVGRPGASSRPTGGFAYRRGITRVTAKKASRKPSKPKVRRLRRSDQKGKPKAAVSLAIADWVRVPAEQVMGPSAAPTPAATARRESIGGLICSIRDVRTGALVSTASGDLSHYLLEIVPDRCFQSRFASDRNSGGPRGPESVTANPVWRELRHELREATRRGELPSHASGGLDRPPFAGLLDGWRLLRARANHVEPLESGADA